MMKTQFNSRAQIVEDGAAIKLFEVRLSYPHIVAPARVMNSTRETYSGTFICNFDPASRDLVSSVLRGAWKSLLKIKDRDITNDDIPPGKSFMSNGNHKKQPEYKGFLIISASETTERRPKVYDRNGNLTSDPNACYAGCLVNAIIRPWAQDNEYGQRVNAGLVGVQFCADFERLGAPVIQADNLFEGVKAGQEYTDRPKATGSVSASDDGYQDFDTGAHTASNPPVRSGYSGGDLLDPMNPIGLTNPASPLNPNNDGLPF